MLYILSARVVPLKQGTSATVRICPLSRDEAEKLVRTSGFVSAVGHAGTAEALTSLLGVEVSLNRVAIFLEKGDKAIQFVLRQRQPEGVVLDRKMVEEIGYDLTFVERVE